MTEALTVELQKSLSSLEESILDLGVDRLSVPQLEALEEQLIAVKDTLTASLAVVKVARDVVFSIQLDAALAQV